MTSEKLLNARATRRFFEIIPGALSWGTFIAIVVFSIYYPVAVAIFIILFDLAWLVRAVHVSVHLSYTYRKVIEAQRIDWQKRLRALRQLPEYVAELDREIAKMRYQWQEKQFSIARYKFRRNLDNLLTERALFADLASRPETLLDVDKIHHVVIIPTAGEPVDVLRSTINAIIASDYDLKRIIFVLAVEERMGEAAKQITQTLEKEYAHHFELFRSYVHPDQVPGEIKAKAPNMAYAARQIAKELEERGIKRKHVVVSAFDSDTQVSPNYFANLTFHYAINPKRTQTSYQPIPLYHNNLWDVPAMSRVAAVSASFWQMIESSRTQRLVTFSSHALSFEALAAVNYWDVDVISDDSRIFWQCYIHFDGDYYVQPTFATVNMDAIQGDSLTTTLRALYKQRKRWAEVENFPYISLGFLRNNRIPVAKRVASWLRMLDSFYSLATTAIILAIGGWLPFFFGGRAFTNSVVSQNLGFLTSTLMTIALVGLVVTFVVSMLLLPKRPAGHGRHRIIGMVAQWILVLPSTIFFGSFPAIHAQTRMMFARYTKVFWVAGKVRKPSEPQVSPRT